MSVCSTYTQSIGMKIFVKCSLLRWSSSILSSAAENFGFTAEIKFDTPNYLFSKICEIQNNTLRERGLFPKGGRNNSPCFNIFTIGIYHNCHLKGHWMALSGWNYCR